jgi:uncharacterized protein (TIGR03437 family)
VRLALAILFPGLIFANSAGAPPGSSGAPGEGTCAASGCHSIQTGTGSLAASFGTTLTYVPGVPQQITVTITDPTARRWGFQATARATSNPRAIQAGDFEPVDTNTQVLCDNGSLKAAGQPCSVSPAFQYIDQTLAGTQPDVTGSVTFQFQWTPSEPSVGNVIFYFAAEAANDDNLPSGDHLYTTTYTLTPTTVAKPAINNNGVVNAADSSLYITPGGWATIYGVNLATTTRSLLSTDIVDNQLPVELAGVSVNIDNQPAFLSYVSPTQINVLPATDTKTGSVAVQVNFAGQSSNATVTQETVFPALFSVPGSNYVAAQHGDGTPIGPSTLFFPAAGSPAQPGETVVIYGSGFGETDPPVTVGYAPTQVSPLPVANALSVTINGIKAAVAYAGLSPGSFALYQFNVIVPDTLGNGNYSVVIQYLAKSTQSGLVLAVQP